MALGPLPADPASLKRARAGLAGALRDRGAEIEAAVLTRANALAGGTEDLDPAYRQGLRSAVSVAIEYGLEAIEAGEERAPPPPPLLLAQARLAARNKVGLDKVLRRYTTGYLLLSDFLAEEAERQGLGAQELRRVLRIQAVLDRLLEAVSEEYCREDKGRSNTREERLAERIERLLAGEAIETEAIAYEFGAHHTALLACGEGTRQALESLASAMDCRLLALSPEEGLHWAWLGGRRSLEAAELKERLTESLPKGAIASLGEPGEGLEAWRLGHRQASAALAVAQRGPEPVVRYAEVALVASALGDELLMASLRKLYLEPLEAERDGGEVAFATLRAYFAAGRNVSSAAAELGVKRHTIAKRLRAVEGRIGRRLPSCAADLELALRLSQLKPSA